MVSAGSDAYLQVKSMFRYRYNCNTYVIRKRNTFRFRSDCKYLFKIVCKRTPCLFMHLLIIEGP